MYGKGKRVSAREYAESLIESTKCGDVFSVSLTTKTDREAIRLLITGSVNWDIGFRIAEFYGETLQLERY